MVDEINSQLPPIALIVSGTGRAALNATRMVCWVNTRRILWGVLAFLCLGLTAQAEATFTVFVPTGYRNPLPARYDALRLEYPDVEAAALSETVSGTQQNSAKKIIVYISPDRTETELRKVLGDIVEQFSGKPIEVRFFGKGGTASLGNIVREMKKERRQLRIKIGAPVDPERTERVIERMAQVKSVLGASQRAMQLSYTGIENSPAGYASAASLVSADALVNYYGTKYETEIGRAFSGHPLPIVSGFGFKRLQNIYSESKVARFIKGTAANLLVWGVGANAAFQTMSHGANPAEARLATGEDYSRWVATSAVGSLVYFSSFTGLEKLRQRGWIKQSTMDLYLRGNGVLYQVASVANSSGNPGLLAWFGPLIGTHWGVHLIPSTLGNVLPVKNDRLVIVDNQIKDRKTIDHLEGLESTAKAEKTEKGMVYRLKKGEEVVIYDLKGIEALKPASRNPLGKAFAAIRTLCGLSFAKASR